MGRREMFSPVGKSRRISRKRKIFSFLSFLAMSFTLLQAFPNQSFASPQSADAWTPVVSDLYYEFWYFDASAETGETLILGIAVIGNIEKDAKVRIDLIIYMADGKMVDATHILPFSDFSASKEIMDVTVGVNYARESPPFYEVYISNGTVSSYLLYEAEMPTWQDFAPPWLPYGNWVVILPRGSVSGWYSISGQRYSVVGVGYHDHIYMMFPDIDYYQGLPSVWLRVLGEGTTVVFGRSLLKSQVLAVFFEDDVYEVSNVNVEMGNNSFRVVGFGKNSVVYLELAFNRLDLLYIGKAWSGYKGLFSAYGIFSSKTFRSPLRGTGIAYFMDFPLYFSQRLPFSA